MEFIDLKAQLAQMRTAIEARMHKVLDHGHFIMGPEVAELEQQLADYVGVKHCVSCANGTDALHISLMALGVGKDDIVFTSAFSFFASAEVIPLVNATPYFCDIDPNTYNLCPQSLEQAILAAKHAGKGQPKAVIAVDLFGLSANYPAIQAVCDKYGLLLIEDGAQSFGGSMNTNAGEQRCGSFGDMATTSFFPAKPLGCYGDGGAIFTNNDKLAALAKSIRVHGKGEHKYDNVRIGVNSRLDTIQAAVLLEKLVYFPAELAARQQLAERYQQGITQANIKLPHTPQGYRSAWAQFTLSCTEQNRSTLQQQLKQAGVPSGIYYPKALPQQPALAAYPSVEVPNALLASEQVLSLPMHGYMPASDVEQVIQAINP